MTKESLKQQLDSMNLESDFKQALFGIIDQAREVDGVLVNFIADLLEMQADFEAGVADMYEGEGPALDRLHQQIVALQQSSLLQPS